MSFPYGYGVTGDLFLDLCCLAYVFLSLWLLLAKFLSVSGTFSSPPFLSPSGSFGLEVSKGPRNTSAMPSLAGRMMVTWDVERLGQGWMICFPVLSKFAFLCVFVKVLCLVFFFAFCPF